MNRASYQNLSHISLKSHRKSGALTPKKKKRVFRASLDATKVDNTALPVPSVIANRSRRPVLKLKLERR